MAGVGWGSDSSCSLPGWVSSTPDPGRENTKEPLFQEMGGPGWGGRREPSPWSWMSTPVVPGAVAGTFLTFWAVPVNCTTGTRVADASSLPLPSRGCLTSSVPTVATSPKQMAREVEMLPPPSDKVRGAARASYDGLCLPWGCFGSYPRREQTPPCVLPWDGRQTRPLWASTLHFCEMGTVLPRCPAWSGSRQTTESPSLRV